MRVVGRWIALALIVGPLLAACAGEPSSSAVTPATYPTTVDPAAITTWLAGLRVERDPDALDEDTQTLTEPLGWSLVVSPASCIRGLPSDVDSSDYVLGAVAPTRVELDDLLARIDREPLFEVEVQVLCTD